ncbi:MAG TPA: translocation/assembly module TamB domain-containing protein [Pyrinomonadaceae bacterium]|nr:translocation/assembly module TamB domain-containing protein [Pyrinomonadaceae bacterium]
MSPDERDPRQTPPADESAPLRFEEPPGGQGAPAPLTPKGRRARWRRIVNRRNAMWTGVVAVVAAVALVIIIFLLYRSGQVDRIIARQLIGTLARYNIRAEIDSFETKFSPRTAELRGLRLYNSVTGAQIGKVDRVLAKVRIEDMWALSLRREVDLEELTVDGLELWVKFDEQGRSNFAELTIPPPRPNERILFAYSTAKVTLNGAVVHYDDDRYDISGEARNVRALVQPDDPNAPEESRMNRIDLWLSDSTFVYNGRPVERIDLELHARANQVRADINELVLRSPVTEARLSGVMDDWRALRYRMKVNASVDLTQTSDVLQLETTVRGAGRFEGTVAGEGEDYRVEGQIVSDALAADGIRLQALNVNATASGRGSSYEAQGRAVAELLSAGDFQLNVVQLAGRVTGTGTDFRWVGDLRAAAARGGAGSIAGLILSDAEAELRDERLTGSAAGLSAGSVTFEGGRASGVQASGIDFERAPSGEARVTVDGARASSVVSDGTTVSGVQASGVEARVAADSSAEVAVRQVRVGGLQTAQARTGALNIAGVRLSVSPGGRVEGSSGDINAGTVAFTTGRGPEGQGRAENVRLARPRFVLEPGGRYRASADLSLGGGVLGTMKLGSARAAVVATGDQIQLNDFVAEVFGGRAQGSATVATGRRGTSSVRAGFENVDVGGLVAALTGRAVPLTGGATGTANLTFPGTNFQAASGRLEAQFSGATGRDETARTPLTGDLALTADRGLFQIERANLRTGATELSATGRFSFAGGSDLAVDLNSADAAELQAVALSTGLLPDLEERVREMGVGLAGNLTFKGRVTGDLDRPVVNGRFELGSLTVRGRDLGALSADIASDAAATRIENGRLVERDGGGAQFAAVIPRAGVNNISFEATLENANAADLVAALGLGGRTAPGATPPVTDNLAGLGPASGRISVTGYPGAMSGSADLRVAAGRIGGQPYEEIAARATFSGSKVNLERLDARLSAGLVSATGEVDIETQSFDLRARGENVQLGALAAALGGAAGRLPQLGGAADFTASASGSLLNPTSYRAEIDAKGRDVTVNGRPAGELTLVGRTTADQKFNVELTTGLLGRPQTLRAQIDLAGEGLPLTFETSLAGADLTPLFAALLPPEVRVTGRATGTLRASGALLDEEGAFTASALSGRAEFTELTVTVEDVPLTAQSPLVVLFSPREITFEQTRFTGPGTNIRFGGTAAVGAGGRQNFTVDGDLNLRVLSNPQQNFFLSGAARVGVRVAGTFEDPLITGTASLANASFALLITDERLTATNINGTVRFNGEQASVETLTGRLGGGRFEVTGGALLAGFRPSQFRLGVRGQNVTVPFPQDFRTTADAALDITGRADSQVRVSGEVNVRRAEYTEDIDLADIIDRRTEQALTAEAGGGGGEGLLAGRTTLDLSIQGRDALVVRNNLADIVGSINLRAVGPVDDPVISGRITATRGTLAFRNDRFEIQRAIIDLPPRRGADPVLNILAEAEIAGYRITPAITGPLSQPVVNLRSDPALPQADIVSLITTGSLATGEQSFSTIAQTGLGTATSLLTESLINAPVRRATDKLFGLNRFEFDPIISGRGGASPTARLTVGRQINRDLAVTFSTNVTGEPNQVIAVVYRVSDRLSFVAQYQQGATDALRTRSNNFNFELRFRKRY